VFAGWALRGPANRLEESSKDIVIWTDGERIESRPQGEGRSNQSGRSYETVVGSGTVAPQAVQKTIRWSEQKPAQHAPDVT
jgi:hypothetical protein